MLCPCLLASVQPPTAIRLPSGEMATALTFPSLPSPIGTRKTRSGLPLANSHTRTVLSSEPVTRYRLPASTPMGLMAEVCIPVSIRRTGSRDGPPGCCANTALAAGVSSVSKATSVMGSRRGIEGTPFSLASCRFVASRKKLSTKSHETTRTKTEQTHTENAHSFRVSFFVSVRVISWIVFALPIHTKRIRERPFSIRACHGFRN